jgi:AcrR family transcriptional regulator
MTPDELGCDQRRRLEAAMVEAVARHGYAGTTLRELARLAGVSKTTFYTHFESKEDCFWATYEAIDREASERVLAASYEGEGLRDKLRSTLIAYAEFVVATPKAASLVAVESLCLGSAAASRREASAARFEVTLRKCYAVEPGDGEVPEVAVRGAAGGYRQVVYRCLRRGRAEQLGECADELADWVLSYRYQGRAHLPPSFFFQEGAERKAAQGGPEQIPALPGWEEPPDSRRSRRALTQRQRIVRAVGRLACERGYANLNMSAISAAAGVSNQTFYQEFSNKQEAFLAAFEELGGRALAASAAAFAIQEDWRNGFAAALAALLSFIATETYFARLAFFELSAAGPAGLDRADGMMDRFLAHLDPPQTAGSPSGPPEVVRRAIGGGIWAAVEIELSHGRGGHLSELAPSLADFALIPFGAA